MNDREKLLEAAEILNHYRNRHYNESSATEEYKLAQAINDILPTLAQVIVHGVTVQESDGCDFCKKFDFAGARAEVDKYGAHISLAICNTKFPVEKQFEFCPMCGRKMLQPPKGA